MNTFWIILSIVLFVILVVVIVRASTIYDELYERALDNETELNKINHELDKELRLTKDEISILQRNQILRTADEKEMLENQNAALELLESKYKILEGGATRRLLMLDQIGGMFNHDNLKKAIFNHDVLELKRITLLRATGAIGFVLEALVRDKANQSVWQFVRTVLNDITTFIEKDDYIFRSCVQEMYDLCDRFGSQHHKASVENGTLERITVGEEFVNGEGFRNIYKDFIMTKHKASITPELLPHIDGLLDTITKYTIDVPKEVAKTINDAESLEFFKITGYLAFTITNQDRTKSVYCFYKPVYIDEAVRREKSSKLFTKITNR